MNMNTTRSNEKRSAYANHANRKETAMNKILTTALATAMTFASIGAARAADVTYDYDAKVGFASWKSWAWKRPDAASGASFTDTRIRRALDQGFTAEGYDEVEPEQADFLIDYRAAGYRELRIDDGLAGPFRHKLRVDSQPMGVLLVEVFDRKTGHLAWRGTVSDDLASDPEDKDEATAKAVTKLLKKFPPPNDEK